MATKKASTKNRSRAARKVAVRDLVPTKRKGAVKGGSKIELNGINFAKLDLEFKPR